MPIKGEQQGYTYKALINGEWQDVTIQESPLELVERFEQDEEWTRVRHGHWVVDEDGNIKCSECGHYGVGDDYCERCGAKMDQRRERRQD